MIEHYDSQDEDECAAEIEAGVERLPLTEAQTRELDRRAATLDANPEAVTPWEVVEERAWERLAPRDSPSS